MAQSALLLTLAPLLVLDYIHTAIPYLLLMYAENKLKNTDGTRILR
jgi:hypothetical protein